MKEALFFSFLGIFVITAVVTLLGVAQRIRIERRYLNSLFAALLIELCGAVIGLFKVTDFFPKTTEVRDPSLALNGTQWTLTDPYRQYTMILLQGGKVFFWGGAPAEQNSWQLNNGSNIVMRFGGGTVENRGILEGNVMQGTATNIANRQSFAWKAQRVF
jgi:hypothetical protein